MSYLRSGEYYIWKLIICLYSFGDVRIKLKDFFFTVEEVWLQKVKNNTEIRSNLWLNTKLRLFFPPLPLCASCCKVTLRWMLDRWPNTRPVWIHSFFLLVVIYSQPSKDPVYAVPEFRHSYVMEPCRIVLNKCSICLHRLFLQLCDLSRIELNRTFLNWKSFQNRIVTPKNWKWVTTVKERFSFIINHKSIHLKTKVSMLLLLSSCAFLFF